MLGNCWSSSIHQPRIQRKSTEKALSVKQWRSVLSSHTCDIPTSAGWNPDHVQALVPEQQDGAVRNGRTSLHLSVATWKLLCTAVEREKQPVTCSWKMQEPLCKGIKVGQDGGMARPLLSCHVFLQMQCKISRVEHSISTVHLQTEYKVIKWCWNPLISVSSPFLHILADSW